MEFKCDTCNKKLKSKQNLKNHIKAIHGNFEEVCQRCHCIMKHTKKYNAEQHRKNCFRTVFPCHLCPKKYFKIDLFKEHYLSHSKDQQIIDVEEISKIYTKSDRIECPSCDKSYTSVANLRVHHKNSIYCKQNLAKKPQKVNIARNSSRNNIFSERTISIFECKNCQETFPNEGIFRIHLNRHQPSQSRVDIEHWLKANTA